MKTALIAGLCLCLGVGAGFLVSSLLSQGEESRPAASPAGASPPAGAQPFERGVAAKHVPELGPLDNWVGEWDTVMTMRQGEEKPREIRSRVKARWVVDGGFVEQQEEPPGKKAVTKNLMSYDAAARVYRGWFFFGVGGMVESTGTWDAEKRSMTWTTKETPDGRISTIVSNFSEPGVEVWTVQERDRAGNVVSEINGKARRRR